MRRIIDVLKKHSYHFSPKAKTFHEGVSELENHFIQTQENLTKAHPIVADLWKMKRDERIQNINSKIDFSEISEFENFNVLFDKIVCDKHIPITTVKWNNKTIILDSEKIKALASLGLGITQFRIEKDQKIRSVYCDGKHPNVDPHSSKYCSQVFQDLDLNLENLQTLLDILGYADLDKRYYGTIDEITLLKMEEVLK